MSGLSISEINEELDFEFFLDRESIAFRKSRGSSGMQFHLKTCPACGDERWRTYMGEDSGLGNCFVCNASFNNLTFVHRYLGFEAKDRWGETFSFLRDVLKEQGWRPKREAVEVEYSEEARLPESISLPTPNGENLTYLEQRGFSGEVSKYFAFRYCQHGWWLFKDEDNKHGSQNFSNRVIIPVFDVYGSLKTFQGRDLGGVSDRKYLFPKMLPGTGRFLLNGQNVMATDSVCMGEGAFDVAAIKVAFDQEASLRHVVPIGSFGKHLSHGALDGRDQLGQFLILKSRGLKNVTIMWDGEKKALLAALDAAKILTGIGLLVRIALLPPGKDPNEVPYDVVRSAYVGAKPWTPALDVKWRLRNPYK